jgi:hypothetical protein
MNEWRPEGQPTETIGRGILEPFGHGQGQEITYIVQAPDKIGADEFYVRCFGWGSVHLGAGQFVTITCVASGRRFFGQVAAPQLNLNRIAVSEDDCDTINTLQELVAERLDRRVVIREVFYYRVRLWGEIIDGRITSITRRPQVASIHEPSTKEETIRCLGLPPATKEAYLGTIVHTDIPVHVDRLQLKNHLLVAGSPGGGKSNTLGNVVDSAQALGICTIIYDHKPDYQHVHEPNDEGPRQLHFHGLHDVSYWSLRAASGINPEESPITVQACDLDSYVLAHTICYRESEANAAEVLSMLIPAFAADHGGRWTWQEFVRRLPRGRGAAVTASQMFDVEIHAATYGSMLSRIDRGRLPPWIDGQTQQSMRTLLGVRPFRLEQLIQPGHILVIRIPSEDGDARSYGLFLSYILEQVYRLRETRAVSCPILHLIDEAGDIFDAGRALRDAVGGMLLKNIRKGRSLRVGFAIGVQSADSVPENIRNLLNTQIIHRHNNHNMVREAMASASPEMLAMTDTFGPGETLAYIYGSRAPIHCQMRLSPFRLTKEDEEEEN